MSNCLELAWQHSNPQVRSLKNRLKQTWIKDKANALIIAAITTLHEKPFIATASASPEAAGCSVSVTTITKIESPIAEAAMKEFAIEGSRN